MQASRSRSPRAAADVQEYTALDHIQAPDKLGALMIDLRLHLCKLEEEGVTAAPGPVYFTMNAQFMVLMLQHTIKEYFTRYFERCRDFEYVLLFVALGCAADTAQQVLRDDHLWLWNQFKVNNFETLQKEAREVLHSANQRARLADRKGSDVTIIGGLWQSRHPAPPEPRAAAAAQPRRPWSVGRGGEVPRVLESPPKHPPSDEVCPLFGVRLFRSSEGAGQEAEGGTSQARSSVPERRQRPRWRRACLQVGNRTAMGSGTPALRKIAASDPDGSAQSILQAGGLQAIVTAMNMHGDCSDMMVPALGALRSLTQHPEGAAQAGATGAVEAVTAVMKRHPTVPGVQRHACSVLCNLAG